MKNFKILFNSLLAMMLFVLISAFGVGQVEDDRPIRTECLVSLDVDVGHLPQICVDDLSIQFEPDEIISPPPVNDTGLITAYFETYRGNPNWHISWDIRSCAVNYVEAISFNPIQSELITDS